MLLRGDWLILEIDRERIIMNEVFFQKGGEKI